MNGDNDQIRRLQSVLQEFQTLVRSIEVQRLQRIQSVLEGFKPLFDSLRRQQRRTALRFNVFEALEMDRREQAHSQFIAYLLNPAGRHDQGETFLISFLNLLANTRQGFTFCPDSNQDANVKTEFHLGSYGRIDIHVRLANGQIILLENKIDAQEDHCQIGRYQKWLQGQDAPLGFPHRLVFLTPEGRRPESTHRPEEVICLSYSHLADWMVSSRQSIAAARLREAVEQYSELCRRIEGNDRYGGTGMTDEIRQFFLDPERLETALDIEAHLPEVKRDLHEAFWREVKGKLTERLRTDGHDLLWEIKLDDNLFRGGFNFANWYGWQIAWRDRRNQPHFAVRIEFNSGQAAGMFFGIRRGAAVGEADLVGPDMALRDSILRQGFSRRNEWWPGYRFFHDLELPSFDLSRADDVLKLCREMQNDDSPLRHRVVELIWELFCDFRHELEDLNNEYPYEDNH